MQVRLRLFATVLVAALAAGWAVPALAAAAPADLDASFSDDGRLTANLGSDRDSVRAVVVQPDGRIVVAGALESGTLVEFAFARFTSSGGPSDIQARVPVRGLTRVVAAAAAPDGGIVALGATDDDAASTVVVRLTSAGTPDPAFGVQGVATMDGRPSDVAVQPGGGVLVSGFYQFGPGERDGIVRRLTSKGVVDAAFGGKGAISLPDTPVTALAVQADGGFVVTGDVLRRYLASGAPDAAFTPPAAADYGGTDVLAQPDGRVVTLGPGFVERRLASGQPDAAFGHRTLDFTATAAALQADGRIVVAGIPAAGTGTFVLRRLLAGGAPDGSFGTGGQTQVPGAGTAGATALALQPDGRVLVAGPGPDAALARLSGDAVPMCDGRFATITGAGDISGTAGPDVIVGSDGADRIVAGGGADVICAGAGQDTVDGGAGDDILRTRDGFVDTLLCGDGADTITADAEDALDASCEVPPAITAPDPGTGTGDPSPSAAGGAGAGTPQTPTIEVLGTVSSSPSKLRVKRARVVRVRKGRATMRIVCSGFVACTGAEVALRLAGHKTSFAAQTQRVAVPAGKTVKVTFRLTAKAMTLLARRGTLHAAVVVTHGGERTVSARFTIRG